MKMRKLTSIVVLVFVLTVASSAFANPYMVEARIKEAQIHAKKHIASVPNVTYDDLRNNTKEYKDQDVAVKGILVGLDTTKAFILLSENNDPKKIMYFRYYMPYRWKLNQEYTIVGRFKDIGDPLPTGNRWAYFQLHCNWPYFDEWL